MKSVCAKHEQAYEDSCPYCEQKSEGPTAAPAAPPVLAVVSPFAKAVDARIRTAKDMLAKGLLYGIDPTPTPWRFTAHDYDAMTWLCRRCGHYFYHSGQPSCPVSP